MGEISKHIFTDKDFLGVVKKAVDFFEHTPLRRILIDEPFVGSGVYALYYNGNFDLYKKLFVSNNGEPGRPIYVGKAVAPGWRTARNSKTINTNTALFNRIREHFKSIDQVSNLFTIHFLVRFMVLTAAEIDLVVPVEAELIRRYTPLWNCHIDGFGNHDPGNGRYKQAVSEWDAIHPGRRWVKRLSGNIPDVKIIHRKIETLF